MRNVAQCAVTRLGAALAQVARNGRNYRSLHLRIAVDLELEMMYCVCRWCPWWLMNLPVSRRTAAAASQLSYSERQFMQRLQFAEKLQRVGSHRLGLPRIDAIASRRG